MLQKKGPRSELAACKDTRNRTNRDRRVHSVYLNEQDARSPRRGVVTEKGEFERAKSLRGIQLVELRLQGRGRDGLGDEAVEEAPAERRVDLRLVGVR